MPHSSTPHSRRMHSDAPPMPRQAAARLIIQDWHSGRIPYFTLPPQREAASAGGEGVRLVAEWGPEFDAANAAILQTLPDNEAADPHFETPSAGAIVVDMDTARDADGALAPGIVACREACLPLTGLCWCGIDAPPPKMPVWPAEAVRMGSVSQ